MTNEQLRDWSYRYAVEIMGGKHSDFRDGVHFVLFGENCISYRYGNATGLVFSDSFYNGHDNHDPGCRISPRYSNECKYSPVCKPDLASIAAGVKESWTKFIGG